MPRVSIGIFMVQTTVPWPALCALLGPGEVSEMRSEAREKLIGIQQKLLQRIERLHNLKPEDTSQECAIAAAICKTSDSFVKTTDTLNGMFGLVAPRAEVTNNNLQLNVNGKPSEEEFLGALARLRANNYGPAREV